MDIWKWIGERVAEFDGPAWTSLALGFLALVLSLYSLWRQRIQRPVFRIRTVVKGRMSYIWNVSTGLEDPDDSADPALHIGMQKYGGELAEGFISARPVFGRSIGEKREMEHITERVSRYSYTVPCKHTKLDIYLIHIRFRLLATPRFVRHRFSIRRASPSAN